MKRFLSNEDGFTLIELMVVVAIIGVLSAIAVPNFKKYQAKAKQSEAKIQLAAVYSTEIAAQADYDAFGTCLVDLGYDQAPRGYYAIGFNAVYTTGITDRSGTCSGTFFFTPTATNGFLKAGGSTPTAISLTTALATATTFTASAEGNIAGSANDVWSITEGKALKNDTPSL